MNKFKLIFFSIVFCFGFSFLGLQNVEAIEYQMLGGRPANPDPNVENSSSWFIYNLNSGEAKEDAVEVMNLFTEDWEALIYAGDTVKSSSGGFAVRQFSAPKLKVGAWVRFYPNDPPEKFESLFAEKDRSIIKLCEVKKEDYKDPEKKEIENSKKLKNPFSDSDFQDLRSWCTGEESVQRLLKSKERIFIPFVFRVPEGTEIGEHTGGILIQKVAPEVKDNGGGSAIKLTTRVGVRIYQTVPGEIIRKLALTDFKITKNFKEFSWSDLFGEIKRPQEYLITTTAKNEGNVSMEQDETIHIKDLFFGKRTVDIPRNFRVMKKDSFISNYSWRNPRFGYFSFVTEIKYQTTDGEDIILNSDEIKLLIMPWREITIALIVFVLALLGYFIRRYFYKKKFGGVGWIEYKVKKGDEINGLAKKFEIDWVILTKTNKLKAPYLLDVGQTILVPNPKDDGTTPKKGKNLPVEDDVVDEKDEVAETSKKKPAKKKTISIAKLMKKKSKSESIKSKNIFSKKIIWLVVGFGTLLVILIILITLLLISNQKKNQLLMEQLALISQKNQVASLDVENKKEETPVEVEKEPDILVEEIEVNILNAGALSGSAGKVKSLLVEKGYLKSEAGDGEGASAQGFFIFYKDETFKKEAVKIQEILKENNISSEVELAESDEEKNGDVVVILGK